MPAISTNLAANNAVRYLNQNTADETNALSKLSSGSRIVNASDDASGLAIATRISSDITTLTQAATNAAQATAILQTADGGASNISDILARMKSIASEAASGTAGSDTNRASIQAEFANLATEIDNIAVGTRYNGTSLLSDNNAFSSGVSVLVGSSGSDVIDIKLQSLSTNALGLASTTSGVSSPLVAVDTQTGATSALAILDSAINTVSNARAVIGAEESQFNFSADSIQTQVQNLTAAKSAITDVDVAAEQAALSSAQVKVSAAVSAEVAANQSMSSLLKLFG
jgi:flagellin